MKGWKLSNVYHAYGKWDKIIDKREIRERERERRHSE